MAHTLKIFRSWLQNTQSFPFFILVATKRFYKWACPSVHQLFHRPTKSHLLRFSVGWGRAETWINRVWQSCWLLISKVVANEVEGPIIPLDALSSSLPPRRPYLRVRFRQGPPIPFKPLPRPCYNLRNPNQRHPPPTSENSFLISFDRQTDRPRPRSF